MIAHARQILDPSSLDEYYRVFLQIMPFARDVSRHLDAVGEANPRDFAQGRVGLLGRHRPDVGAHTSLLRRAFGIPIPSLLQGIKSVL